MIFQKLKNNANVMEFLKKYVLPRYAMIVLAIICVILSSGSAVVFTALIAPAVDSVLIHKNFGVLYTISFLFLLLFIIRGVTDFGERFYLTKIGLVVIKELQEKCFSSIIRYDLAAFRTKAIGDIISRLTNDITQLNQTFIENILKLCKDSLTLICLCLLMFVKNYKLALLLTFMFVACGIPAVKIGKKVKQLMHISLSQVGTLNSFLFQVLHGMRLIKSYCSEEHEIIKSRKIIDQMCRNNMKTAIVKSYMYPIVEGVAGIAVCCSFIIGGGAVISGESSPGVLIQFIMAFVLAYRPIRDIGNVNSLLQAGIAAADRVFSLMDIKPKILDKENVPALLINNGRIDFKAVTFSYGSDIPILNNLSFTIKPGEKVAIVGATGAGKSTVVNLLLRFYEVMSGKITIDEQDIRDVSIESLRKSISLVAQDVVLFNDTIAYNISYGSFDVSLEDIEQSAKIAGVYDFVQSLPDKFNHIVGDRGINLSGGQRQKISIARAILKNAPILIFDEATSSLDQASENDVKVALDRLSKNKTTIIIAHRLSTIVNADKIIVLDNGSIVEIGTHQDLLKNGGKYANLYSQNDTIYNL